MFQMDVAAHRRGLGPADLGTRLPARLEYARERRRAEGRDPHDAPVRHPPATLPDAARQKAAAEGE